MASRCRRYRTRRFKALGHDPQLLVIRPATPPTSLNDLKPFKLSTALMAVHKDCYAPIGLIQQGGPRRRETSAETADRGKCRGSCCVASPVAPVLGPPKNSKGFDMEEVHKELRLPRTLSAAFLAGIASFTLNGLA